MMAHVDHLSDLSAILHRIYAIFAFLVSDTLSRASQLFKQSHTELYR